MGQMPVAREDQMADIENATTPAEAGAPAASTTTTTYDDVRETIRNEVYDPELGLNIIDLGLVYDIDVADHKVDITMTLTSPGCPIGPEVAEQIEEFVSELDGVEVVDPTMTFSPPWTPERMSEDAKFALGF